MFYNSFLEHITVECTGAKLFKYSNLSVIDIKFAIDR